MLNSFTFPIQKIFVSNISRHLQTFGPKQEWGETLVHLELSTQLYLDVHVAMHNITIQNLVDISNKAFWIKDM